MDKKFIESLTAVVGEDNFTDSVIDLVSFSYDSSGLSQRPEAAVWVQTTEQVSAILKLANTYKIPITPRGAGTLADRLGCSEAGWYCDGYEPHEQDSGHQHRGSAGDGATRCGIR